MTTMDMVAVRPRRPEDDEFIRKLAHRAFLRYSPAPARFVMRLVEEPSAGTIVAEADGLRCGFAVVSFEPLGRRFGPWQRPVVASLEAIAVHPELQRQGIGRVLLAEAEGHARRQRAVTLSLRTAVDNASAQALFRAAGFQVAAEIPRYYRGGQRALAMTKLIAT